MGTTLKDVPDEKKRAEMKAKNGEIKAEKLNLFMKHGNPGYKFRGQYDKMVKALVFSINLTFQRHSQKQQKKHLVLGKKLSQLKE